MSATVALCEPATHLFLPEEVLVSADPQDRAVSQISSSISVIGSDTLQNQGSESLAQSLSLIPNVNFAGGSNRPRFFQIRGIGELDQYEGAPNYSSGFYIDDIDLSGLASGANTFDVSQFEVLRGPQATAYGANALAGVIHLSTTPLEAGSPNQAKFSFGSDNLSSGGFAYGTSDYRISIFHEQENGFREDQFLHRSDTNSRDITQAELKYKKEITKDSSIELNALRIDTRDGYDAFAIDNSFHTESDRPGKDDMALTGLSARYQNKLSADWKLTSVTSFTGAQQNYSFDGDWGNNPFWGQYAPYDYFSRTYRTRHAIWEDLRLSDAVEDYKIGRGARYLVAGYAQRFFEDTTVENSQNGAIYDSLYSRYQSTTLAAYGQRETPLFDRTSLTTGFRLERKGASYSDSRLTTANPEDVMTGGSISLQREIVKDTTAYALVSKGYRAGGVNTGLNIPDDRRTFNNESLWNYEIGAKSYFPSIKTTSNLSLFIQESKDAQVKGSYQLNPNDPLTFTYITDNAATGSGQGAEWEVQSAVTDRLSVNGQLSLLETNLDANTPGLLQNRARSHAPSWQYSIAPRYQLTNNFYTQLQATGKGSFYYDDTFNQRSSPYSLINGEIGYEKNGITVSFWAKNIFDKRYAVRGFYFGDEPPDFPNKSYIQLGDPLSMGVTVSVRF